ncbi:HNH endonuclease [Sphingobium fuliginis]|nr:HNH endonuclease [Sphingobium fuliginis]
MKGRWIAYSPDEMEWLEANRLMVISDYHRAFCETFGRGDVSLSNLHSLRKRKGWATGRSGHFVKGEAPHNKGKPCEPGKGGRHPNARRTQFKKGQTPHNTNYLGHERISTDGYVEISVEERNPHTGYERRYVLKHKWLWEQANGPVPEGHALKCLDSNPLNTDPSNWEPVPRGVLARLNGGRFRTTLAYDEASPELKPLVMASAKLKHAAQTARKGSPS